MPGEITVEQTGPDLSGALTWSKLQQALTGLLMTLNPDSVGDAKLIGMNFAKLLTGILTATEGAPKTLTLDTKHVVLKSKAYRADTRNFYDGLLVRDSVTLASATAEFVLEDVGRPVTGDYIPAGATIATFIDAQHVTMSVAATNTVNPAYFQLATRDRGRGWALLGGPDADGFEFRFYDGVFGGSFSNDSFFVLPDGTVGMGKGVRKFYALPDGSFKFGSGGAATGVSAEGEFFSGGEDAEGAVLRLSTAGNLTLKGTAESEHSIDIGAINTTVLPPIMTPNGGAFDTYLEVSLNALTQGSKIYFTNNGASPDKTSTLYTGPMPLEETVTIKAIAYKLGEYSAVTTRTFTEDSGAAAPNPYFSPVPGYYTPIGGSMTIQLRDSLAGTSIRYTTDGTPPTELHGTLISPASGAVIPDGSLVRGVGTHTIKMIAFKSGLANSEVVEGEFTVASGGGGGYGGSGYGGGGGGRWQPNDP